MLITWASWLMCEGCSGHGQRNKSSVHSGYCTVFWKPPSLFLSTSRQWPPVSTRSLVKYSAIACRSRDARAAPERRAAAAALPATIPCQKNIRSAGIRLVHDATPRATSNPALAAAGEYLHPPSVQLRPAFPGEWLSARRSWRDRRLRKRAPASTNGPRQNARRERRHS